LPHLDAIAMEFTDKGLEFHLHVVGLRLKKY
jgi:hypothetical protein